jgi:phosphomannomutase
MFKAYDIRGTYPELNSQLYYWSGYALIKEVFEPENVGKKVILMRDHRYTSPDFYKAVYNGILDAGGEVLALDLGASDMLYGACQLFDMPGAIVTASHNPKDDNGLKVVKKIPQMLGLVDGLDKVRDFVLSKLEGENAEKKDETVFVETIFDEEKKQKVLDYYAETIKKIGDLEDIDKLLKNEGKKLRIGVDAGNGMGGYVMEILKDMYRNIEFLPLFWELDGTYPNHPADPQDFDNLKDLQELILKEKLDFGFAFDGDADRVFFVDENAEVVQGDFLVAVFAEQMLKAHFENPDPNFNPVVVTSQPGSQSIPHTTYKNDGICVPSKQGHTAVKAQMKKYKAIYGGEFSGHHYFGDFGFMDSGVLASVLMIKAVVKNKVKLSELFTNLRKNYFISNLMNIRLPEGETFEDIKLKAEKSFSDADKISYMDGISVFYPDWKFSARPSNTEPVMRFILETYGDDKVEEKVSLVKEALKLK